MDGKQLGILELRGGTYIECEKSGAFPGASTADLSRLVRRSLLY
jgi:hypothetical protein